MSEFVQLQRAITPTHILGSTGTSNEAGLGYASLESIKNLLGITDIESDMSEMIQKLQAIQDLLVEIRDQGSDHAEQDLLIEVRDAIVQSNDYLEPISTEVNTIRTISESIDTKNTDMKDLLIENSMRLENIQAVLEDTRALTIQGNTYSESIDTHIDSIDTKADTIIGSLNTIATNTE